MMMESFTFSLDAQEGRARAGTFQTPHGPLRTPVFAPVGTQASVKALTPIQLGDLGASLLLANSYHLYLRPGESTIERLGGLHRFMNWPGPLLTDSGGFQIFSLADRCEIDSDGATFKSHIDGSLHRFTPEKVILIQEKLGADIIMVLDECTEPYNRNYNEQALQRTHAWAERSLSAKKRPDQALFGIVQGGIFPDLRVRSAEFLSSLEFSGIAVGGLSVGETKQEMHAILETIDPILPENKPRYLMGVGSPDDIVEGVLRGVDIFDSVLPTRMARNHAALTRKGRINLRNSPYINDARPIAGDCGCYTCRSFSRAYLRHLIVSKEILAATLLSIHNLTMLTDLVYDLRRATEDGRLEEFVMTFRSEYQKHRAPGS